MSIYNLVVQASQKQFPIPVPADPTNISDLRSAVEDYLKQFIFVDSKDSPILQYSQNHTPVKGTITDNKIKIKLLSKQKSGSKSAQTLALEVTVVDNIINIKSLVRYNDTYTLSQIRESIAIPRNYETFNFIKGLVQISQSAQKSYKVTDVIKDKQIQVRFKQSEKQQAQQSGKIIDQAGKKKKFQSAMETKSKIDAMVGQLQDFEKKFTQQDQETNKAKMQKLKQISDRLDQMNIQFTFNSSTNIQSIMQQLKKTSKESQNLINVLLKADNYSNNQLASQFANLVGIGVHGTQQVLENAIDCKLSHFEIDKSLNKLTSVDFDYSTQSMQSEHLKQIQTQLVGGTFSAMGGSPFFFIKAGARYNKDWQSQSSSNTANTFNRYYKNFFAVFIGTGLKLTQDNIFLKQIVIKQYQTLFELSKTLNQLQFQKRVQQFFHKYGDHVEAGSFYFGNTFSTDLQVSFVKQQSLYQSKNLAQSALSIAISGGGIFQGGFFAAKAGVNIENSSGSASQKQNLDTQYSMSSHTSSYPAVQNFTQWKQVVSLNNNYWRIISKTVAKVNLLKLLRAPNTINRSPYLQSKSSVEIHAFQAKLNTINDTIVPAGQDQSRQFEGNDFKQISDQLNKMKSPQTFVELTLRRTQIVNFMLFSVSFEIFQPNLMQYISNEGQTKQIAQVSLMQHEFLSRAQIQYNEVCKYLIMKGIPYFTQTYLLCNLRVLAFLIFSSKLFLKQCIYFSQLEVNIPFIKFPILVFALQRFTNLKNIFIFGKFPLTDTPTAKQAAQSLNKRKLNITITLPPIYKPKVAADTNWTFMLEKTTTFIEYKEWN